MASNTDAAQWFSLGYWDANHVWHWKLPFTYPPIGSNPALPPVDIGDRVGSLALYAGIGVVAYLLLKKK